MCMNRPATSSATPTDAEDKNPCACLNGCHDTAATKPKTATPQEIIANLHDLINKITRRTGDGRLEPYCAGDCNFICDLTDIADFSAVQQAAEYLIYGPAYDIARSREALRDRIADICCGACGRFVDDEDETLAVQELARVIPAIQATWPNLPDWVWFPHNLDKFVTVDSITDFIFRALQG